MLTSPAMVLSAQDGINADGMTLVAVPPNLCSDTFADPVNPVFCSCPGMVHVDPKSSAENHIVSISHHGG